MPIIRPENMLGLISPNHGIIEVFLRRIEVGQEIAASDFDAAKNEFYRTVCVGLHCLALINKECSGPKQNVEIHDDTNIMVAQAELKTESPITKQIVNTLKCSPEIFGIV